MIGVLGCLLAVALGAAAATDQGVLVASALVGLTFCGTATIVYMRDPILALIWLWLFEVFNSPISAAFGYFSSTGTAIRQADEVLVLLFVGLTAVRTMRVGTRIPPMRFILPGMGVAFFGILGALVHNVPFIVTILGAWLGLKLWIVIGVTLLLPWKSDDLKRIYTVFTRVGVFVAVLGLADYVTHAAISRALHTSIYRFGEETFRGEAVHSIFPHPGEFSLFMSLLFALTFTRFATKRNKADLALALLFAGSVVLSLRLKGFLALAVVVIIVALVQEMASNRGTITIALVGSLLFIAAYSIEGNVIAQQISTYTSSETAPRTRLYKAGEQIAFDNFPLGVGFGRFGSYPSRIYYSPVYFQYELSSFYGLSQAFPNFLDDTTWPSVIGETGYGGCAIYLFGIIFVLFAIIRRLRVAPPAMKWVSLSALCMMAVLLIDSLGEATLFDWLATTTVAMIFGPAMIATNDSMPSDSEPIQSKDLAGID